MKRRGRALRRRYGRRGHAAWGNWDWMILRSIGMGHRLNPNAQARAAELAAKGFISGGRLTAKGKHAVATEVVA
jgi:hypothetical protein